MSDAPPRCPAAHPLDPAPCDGPPDAVLIRAPFRSRAADAMSEPTPGCVRHGRLLLATLHGGRLREAADTGRLTAGPGGGPEDVAAVLTTEPSDPAPAAPEPERCPAATAATPDSAECDGPHHTVTVRARLSSRTRYGLPEFVPGCIRHAAKLLLLTNGGQITPGPDGTEADATTARRRANAAWDALHAPNPPVPAPAYGPEDTYDAAAAATVHYVDRRVRRLAQARWRLSTGGTYTDWIGLGKDHPDALIREARDWTRAAVAAGIIPPPAP